MNVIHVLGEIILPIFGVVFIGYVLNARGIIDGAFAKTANRIVYSIAIPAMLFNKIAQAPFKTSFNMGAVLCLIGALGLMAALALGLVQVLRIAPRRRGTFLQCSFHGNIGYIAYAIAYYGLGESAFALTAILGGFLMVAQNLIATWILISQRSESQLGQRTKDVLRTLLHNPIILSILAGIAYAWSGLKLPPPIKNCLGILSGMALPTALLLIGATLSFGSIGAMKKEITSIGALKLICLPLLGYGLVMMTHVPSSFHSPLIVLLAAPPATVVYIMATQMGGDPELAATSVSVHTLTAALTYTFLLSILG
jgi:predicted permease